MADNSRIKPTTWFTRAFAAALRDVMSNRGVSQQAVAEAIGRKQGFISERTSGKRACDTDIIAGVAKVAGVTPRTIVAEVMRGMRQLQVVREESVTTQQLRAGSHPQDRDDPKH